MPKETYYVAREWKWKDYQGTEYSKIVTFSRERIHRDPIPATNIELQIIEGDNQKMVFATKIKKEEGNFEFAKHTINLLLELFGECDILIVKKRQLFHQKSFALTGRFFQKGNIFWKMLSQ